MRQGEANQTCDRGMGRSLRPVLLIVYMGLVSLAGCMAPEGDVPHRVQRADRTHAATRPAAKGDFFANQAASQAREDAGQVQPTAPVPSLPPPGPARPVPGSAAGSRW